jgi:hypothetical protein
MATSTDAAASGSTSKSSGTQYFRATKVGVTDGLNHLAPGDVAPATDGLRACYERLGKEALEPASKADYDKFVAEGGSKTELVVEETTDEDVEVGTGAAVGVVGSPAEVQANEEAKAEAKADAKADGKAL